MSLPQSDPASWTTCPVCRAIVEDQQAHADWHASLTAPAPVGI